MKARRPNFEYQDSPAHWSKYHGHSVNMNAGSVILPILEPYLNRVMAMAKAEMGDKHPDVREEVEIFILQEGNHYRQHKMQIQHFYKDYPDLPKFEATLRQDYEDFLKDRSLKFNTAYCEGFESTGLLNSRFFFEAGKRFSVDADPVIRDLWAWHLAEEIEHRMVCYDVQKIFGGYFNRMHGLFFAGRHLGKYHIAITNYMLSVDREKMSPEEVERSVREYKDYQRTMRNFVMPRAMRILSPFYNPKNSPIPQETTNILAMVERMTEAA
jgi:predicted metal-dependent hydrolase